MQRLGIEVLRVSEKEFVAMCPECQHKSDRITTLQTKLQAVSQKLAIISKNLKSLRK